MSRDNDTPRRGDGYLLDAGDAFEDIDGLRGAVRKVATQTP